MRAASVLMLVLLAPVLAAPTPTIKEGSVFYPRHLIEKARANADRYPWAEQIRQTIVQAAQPWRQLSDEHLWNLMFGNTIKRAWQVWSDGYCPSCKQPVPMYNWRMDALNRPWKAQCPHCNEYFPKNDFEKFYRSGLDEKGIFDRMRADRSLLVNEAHRDPSDPLHRFGVDDGEGYVEGEKRWRFIGAYLIFGQWKQAICGGIKHLAAAYLVTGEKEYAHKAGVLLDRVADLYGSFDFGKEGVMYEGPPHAGYISTWHDACEEVRELALAYDQTFEALKEDPWLVEFLSRKARACKLENPKGSFADIQRNIEEGIFRDTLANPQKIRSNYPTTDVALATLKTVLEWPSNRAEVEALLGEIIAKATSVDGLTGEKGLAGYSIIAPRLIALLLGQYSRIEPDYLKNTLQRHPRLHAMYRFHIDTWCLQKYYPQIGDTGGFARPVEQYLGVALTKNPGLNPSMYAFLWNLFELTGDAAFAQVVHQANGSAVEGLPYDLFADNPEAFQKALQEVIDREGAALRPGSVNKAEWHLAILHSGQGKDGRAVWLDYDAGGGHGHADGMNLGLFAKGLDLMPDLGYPPVQYGGWSGPRFGWYVGTPGHNTVVVDGQNQPAAAGKTTLWADGKLFRAIRASGPELIKGRQYERTVAMVDISEQDSYLVDIFRVVGGKDHAKFQGSHFGEIATQGLALKPSEDYGYNTQMRRFQMDPNPQPGWSVDWKIEDRYKLRPEGEEVHLRATDLTTGAGAFTAQSWVSTGGTSGVEEAWIPRVMVRRQGEEPLSSTFVSVIEPYERSSAIARIRRLPLETPAGAACPDANVAVEVVLKDGQSDLFVTADVENPLGLSPSLSSNPKMVQNEWGLHLEGEACWIRRDRSGAIRKIALCGASSLKAGDIEIRLNEHTGFIEIRIDQDGVSVESGDADRIQDVRVKGKSIWRQ